MQNQRLWRIYHCSKYFVGAASVHTFSRLDEGSQPEIRFKEPKLSDIPQHMVHPLHFSPHPRFLGSFDLAWFGVPSSLACSRPPLCRLQTNHPVGISAMDLSTLMRIREDESQSILFRQWLYYDRGETINEEKRNARHCLYVARKDSTATEGVIKRTNK